MPLVIADTFSTDASISAVTLNDVPLHGTAARNLTSASGLLGIGPVRQVTRVRPQAHGGIDDTKYEDARPISLEGLVLGVSDQDAIANFRAIAAAAFASLDTGPVLLKWTEAGGLQLQKTVKLAGPLDPPITASPHLIAYQLSLLAADPRAYAQTQTTVTTAPPIIGGGGLIFSGPFAWQFTASAGGIATASQAGNRSTPPVFRIHGGVTNPAIIRLSNQRRISLIGSIVPGDYVDIDVQNRTIKLNGTSNALSMLDAANTNWSMELPPNPASESYQLTAFSNDTNAFLDVIYRSAYA